MGNLVKRGRGLFPLRGYVGGLEELATMLGVNLEEARIFRITVMQLYLDGYSHIDVLDELLMRGYREACISKEYTRCESLGAQIRGYIKAGVMTRDVGMREFRNRVMCVGGDLGEVSKDEVVSILSGLLLDSRTDVRVKLSAAELIGKYRDYFKSLDREVRIVLEGGDVSVSGQVVSGLGDSQAGAPDGMVVDGGVL